MKIGLLSDSHGDAASLRDGAAILIDLGAEAIVHCGDIVAADHVSILGCCGVPAYLATGNMDRNTGALAKVAEQYKVQFAANFIEVTIGDGQHLVALHGDDEQLMRDLVEGAQFPYIVHGHTHRAADDTYGSIRVICPGALAHPRKPKYPTVALLNTEADTVEFYKVP
jgi:uncharacterized protein